MLFSSKIVFEHVNDSLLVCVDKGYGVGIYEGGVVGLNVLFFYVEDLGLLVGGGGLLIRGGGEGRKFCCHCGELGRIGIGGLFVLLR